MRPILPHNEALVAHVTRHQPIGAAELFTACAASGESPRQFQKRLIYLKSTGWIDNPIERGRVVWRACVARPMHIAPGPTPAAKPAPEAPYVGAVALPRRVNVMHGPVYRETPGQPARAGASDHAALPSVVLGQRRAYGSRSA